jgi:VIT1/CCC1 family predicted Fe2+/Mn2+ transporter
MVAFTLGGLIPLLVVAFAGQSARILVTVAVVALALGLAGWVSARLAISPRLPAIIRNVAGGMLAMGVTYLIGAVVGTRL